MYFVGMPGGRFFRRGKVFIDATTTESSRVVDLRDFCVGKPLRMIGQSFYIADADTFTRNYYR